MNRFFVSLFLSVCLLINCSKGANSTKDRANNGEEIKLKVNLEKEKKMQIEVDSGHQPWRLEPVDVAYDAVKVNINKNINYANCTLISESKSEASVQCGNDKNYIVYMKRLVNPKGIWTATLITVSRSR